MGRGNPLPVAIPVRDVGNVGGGLPVRVSGGGANERDKAAVAATATKKNVKRLIMVPPFNMLR